MYSVRRFEPDYWTTRMTSTHVTHVVPDSAPEARYPAEPLPPAPAILSVCDVHKRFVSRREVVEAVRGISLEICAGRVLAFLGPNGAGKTTTIKMIAGLMAPDRGTVRINGRNPIEDH